MILEEQIQLMLILCYFGLAHGILFFDLTFLFFVRQREFMLKRYFSVFKENFLRNRRCYILIFFLILYGFVSLFLCFVNAIIECIIFIEVK